MSSEQQNNNNTNTENSDQSNNNTPVDVFLDICANLPEEKRQAFRSAGMSLSRKDPNTFQLVFSEDPQEMMKGLEILKQRHNELAKSFEGVEEYKL